MSKRPIHDPLQDPQAGDQVKVSIIDVFENLEGIETRVVDTVTGRGLGQPIFVHFHTLAHPTRHRSMSITAWRGYAECSKVVRNTDIDDAFENLEEQA